MKVVVFGGSQPKESSQAYADARTLGDMLARQGHTVLTGGYTGTMEAVSRGAADAGGHVIGVTCEEIGRWHGRSANHWVTEEWKKGTLLERIQTLIEASDAALALPGGPGTLTEIALTWNLMIVGCIRRRPLILVGEAWRRVWDAFYSQLGDYTPSPQRAFLNFATTPLAAVEMLKRMSM
ncbi:MAG: LOG family protein [Chloroflexota bacterium]